MTTTADAADVAATGVARTVPPTGDATCSAADPPAGATDLAAHGLAGRFLRGLATAPDGVAVRVGAAAVTYRELHETALRHGGAIARAGATAVGVLAGKGPAAYAGVLAALCAGATVVPLRPDFPAERTRHMLDAAGVTVLITDAASRDVAAEVLGDRADVTVLTDDDPGDAAPLAGPARVRPDDTAYVLFTSGSTGRPKGVRLSHGALAHYFALLDERYDFTSADVFSQTFDLNFDCSLFDLFCAWGAGATALAIPAPAYRELPAFLGEHGVTVWFSTPAVVDLVRRTSGLDAGALPGVRWSFFAGEALQCRDADAWQRAAPASTVENLYGPTELTITVSAHRWDGERSAAAAVNGVVPIGTVHPGHAVLLVDDDGAPLPGAAATGAVAGAEGELCVAGPQLTTGYLDAADERGRFLDHDGRRCYRTGDRVRVLPDGGLAYLGRRDSQVQVQGWRVEPAEIEDALRACGVHDAVVVGVAAGGTTELVAFHTGARVRTVDLVRSLRARLPDGMVPRRHVRLDAFPLNSNRKVDRLRLAADAAALLAADAPRRSG